VAIYSSPLSRALDTGQAIADHLVRSYQINIPVQVISDLADFNFGKWEGLTPEEARQHWPEEIEAWYASPQTVHIPGGETLQNLRERAMNVIEAENGSFMIVTMNDPVFYAYRVGSQRRLSTIKAAQENASPTSPGMKQ